MTTAQRWHRRFNNVLTIIVVVLALYIVLAPFLPQLEWWLHPPKGATLPPPKTIAKIQRPIQAGDWLKIPRLSMNQEIHTGPTEYELSKGVWLIPHTSTPDRQSNTVMAGHRFTYAGPAIFYFLDKVQMNDPIIVDWQQKEYTYKVSKIEVVPPTQLSIQDPTPTPTLTLYTCTPLVTAKNRLIVISSLVGVRS